MAFLAVAAIQFFVSAVGGKFGIAGNWVVGKIFPKKKTPRQASILQLTLDEGPREAIFGQAGTGGRALNGWNQGGTYGTDWEVLAIRLADHKCHSLVGFYVDDTYVAFAGNGVVSGFSSKLEVYFLDGSETQTLPSTSWMTGSGFSAGDFVGVCTVFVAYKADDKVWSTGRPSFLWVVKGKFCYDPRLDSTVSGGSGSHRWATPSTWAWTANAEVCFYNWQRGVYACDRITAPDMLLVGRGLSATEAPPDRLIAYANTCDEAVSLAAGGTEARYRVGCVIAADEEFATVTDNFALAMAGTVVQRDGGVEIIPGTAQTPVGPTITDDIMTAEERGIDPWESSTRRLNSLIPRFVDPAQRYKMSAAPVRRVSTATILAEGLWEDDHILEYVTSVTQAQRCTQIELNLRRLERKLDFTLPPRLSYLEDGDWITVNSVRLTDASAVVFRIESYGCAIDRRLTVNVREIASAAYSWSTSDEGTIGSSALVVVAAPTALQMPTTTFAPGTVTGLGLTLATIEATWTAANVDPAIGGAKMEYRVKSGPGTSHFHSTTDISDGRMTASTAVADGVLMEARIQPIPRDPYRSVTWSSWSDVTTTTGTGTPPTTWVPPPTPPMPPDPWNPGPPDVNPN